MPKGRIPKPTALNNLKGDPSKKRRNTKEPEAKKGFPICPSYMDSVAKKEWKEICNSLSQMQLLTTTDRAIIELYCNAYSRYRTALKELEKGEAIPTKNDYLQLSPYSTIANQSFQQMHKILLELGLTPAARARMRIKKEDDSKNKWNGLI